MAVASENPLARRPEICGLVSQLLNTVMAPYEVSKKYNWLIIHDSIRMIRGDTDRIYSAINRFKDNKHDIGLIITSGGGEIEPAYLISKLCRESTVGRFVAVVPRRAKSAADSYAVGLTRYIWGR